MTKNIENYSMEKIGKSGFTALLLLASLLVNIFFVTNLCYEKQKQKLSWSQRAAAEAEELASVSCSGHGRVYLDGFLVDGKPVCECHACYGGLDCSLLSLDCPADADSGDPLFLEPFWMENAASSAQLVAGWHRMSYTFKDHSFISQELDKHIKKVHSIAKNAITDGRFIVFGGGSTQLLNAAVYALSMENNSFSSRVVAKAPFYPLYKSQTEFFQTIHYEFEGDASLLKNSSDIAANVIEFVTSPNNPDGNLRSAALKGPNVNNIYDHAYFWPHFTAIPAPSDQDLMIFTISKLTGHAGTRFGWAIVKDEKVYERMSQYIQLAEMGISRDTQLRALTLLKVIVEGDGKQIFNFAHKSMKARWEKLNHIFSISKRFSLQQIPPQYCIFFDEVRAPSPAYAWVKCEREEDTNCTQVLRTANIIGREGSIFNASSRYVRLSMLKGEDDFDLLIRQVKKLVCQEDEDGAQAISKL